MTSIKKYQDKLNNIIKTLGIDNANILSAVNSNENLYHIKKDTITTVIPYTGKNSIKEKCVLYIKSYWIYIILSIMCFSIIFVSRPKFLTYKDKKEKEYLNFKRYILFSSIFSVIISIIYYRFTKKYKV